MKEEIWKPISGFEGIYEASTFGNVRSVNRMISGIGRNKIIHRKGKILKLPINSRGYCVVSLQGKTHYVHQLIAQTFIPNPMNLPEVNHKDEIKTHNNSNNLEWCDSLYNNLFGTRLDRVAKALINYPPFSRPLLQISKDGLVIKRFPSFKQMTRETGFDRSFVMKCCKGESQFAYGYVWRYEE